MYIREKKTKTTPALQLVRGQRDHNGKVRQQIILSLGNVPIPDELRKTIAHEVENRMNGYQCLRPLEAAWKSLGMSEFLDEHKFSPRQINAVKISIYNRLIDPVSENSLLSWAETTALNELLGEHIELSGEDRFYRASDKLLACQDNLEIHLRERERELFNLNRQLCCMI